MLSRRASWMMVGSLLAIGGVGMVGYNLLAAQAQGALAQAPLNNQVQTPPAFIMAVDDSGSMTFQTQFPAQDGTACWDRNSRSFFNGSALRTSGSTCNYFYVLPGTRVNSYYSIPPIDSLGFARSPTYNPTYFNPEVKYEPWLKGDGTSYGDANPTNTLIDPRGSDTVALGNATYINTASSEPFLMQNGMYLPAGTTYRFSRNGTEYVAGRNGYTWDYGNDTNAWIRYRPAVFYLPYSGDGDAVPQMDGTANVYANVSRVKVDDACGSGCPMWKYSITEDANNRAALQNFANWYSYYGNRNRAMIAGMTRSLGDVNNLRVGYFRINQNGSYDATSKRLVMRDMSVSTDKTALYSEMIALTASGGTPNRQAVNSAGIQFTRTDTAAPIQLSCQKNAVMLFTDGYSNSDGPTVGNKDRDMGVPFADSYSNTMADIASSYYLNINGVSPLRSDLQAGLVPVPQACKDGTASSRVDCQSNLHINFYGVTLGARGNLFNPDVDQDPYTDSSIYNNWPSRQNDNPSTVDDIWHASVNTRGEYINARTPAEITQAMRRVLSSVTSGASSSGTRGITGARIGAGSLSVAPEYVIQNEGTDWFSRLRASRVTVNATTRAAEQTETWEASEKLPSAADRNVFVNKAGSVLPFTSGNVSLLDLCSKPVDLYPGMSRCSAAELLLLGQTNVSALSYLRGDTTGEVRFGGKLRDRGTRLGDIINSSPVVSSPLDDYGYRMFSDLATSYQAYLNTKRAASEYRVFVGANDGMLHSFNGGLDSSGNPTANGGREEFAYIPSTALGHMGNLLFPYNPSNLNDQKFDHRYYVDGQIAVNDTRYNNTWATTLVGASGAGGRSVFALDVTPGSTFTANSRLWEISDLDLSLPPAVRGNIGHVLSKPVIVPMRTGASGVVWRAVFGNGYNSANGKAVLFMVDIGRPATGQSPTITMIEAVEAGSGVPTGSNGLGAVVVLDSRGGGANGLIRDGLADTAYAADQKGALWKFDLTSPSATAITVPLFTTRSYVESGRTLRQPITGGITVTTGRRGGAMLLFGTGSFSFVGDAADTSVQTLYGVEDTGTGQPGSALTRSALGVNTLSTSSGRSVSVGTPPANSVGWYVDLPAGERFVATPSIATGIVFMPTYVPSPEARGCSTNGTNWLFGLNTLTGAPSLSLARVGSPTGTQLPAGTAAVAMTVAGSAPVRSAPVSSLPSKALDLYTPSTPGTPPSEPPAPENSVCWLLQDNLYVPYACGRQSWRQIQ